MSEPLDYLEYDDFLNEPYCSCDNEPDEEEEALNCCKCCGKPVL